jgi:hypothetical protein
MSFEQGGRVSGQTSPATPGRFARIELRSIDYVPLDERHGKVWSQGPLWFMSNAQIATLAVGTFSVVGGGNLIWSMLAIIGGVLFGTFFMAFHSAQGPQLGLPQMIQSRPQFGYVGALLVWAFAYLQPSASHRESPELGHDHRSTWDATQPPAAETSHPNCSAATRLLRRPSPVRSYPATPLRRSA